MRTPARPRLPDVDCVFISGARIVERADAPFIAADMTWLGLTPPTRLCAYSHSKKFKFRNRVGIIPFKRALVVKSALWYHGALLFFCIVSVFCSKSSELMVAVSSDNAGYRGINFSGVSLYEQLFA